MFWRKESWICIFRSSPYSPQKSRIQLDWRVSSEKVGACMIGAFMRACSAQRLADHRVGVFVRVPERILIPPIVNAAIACSNMQLARQV